HRRIHPDHRIRGELSRESRLEAGEVHGEQHLLGAGIRGGRLSEVRTAWAALAGEARTEPGWHARRVHGEFPCDIRAAIGAPGGTLALLFEVQARSIPAGASLPLCVGFELTPETIVPGPGGQIRLCLSLRDTRFRTIFETLADDVV